MINLLVRLPSAPITALRQGELLGALNVIPNVVIRVTHSIVIISPEVEIICIELLEISLKLPIFTTEMEDLSSYSLQ